MPMNLALQRHTIEKKLRNKGINPDKIDLEAELDSTLSLPENIQNLEEKYGRLERTGRNAGARQSRAQAQRRKQAQKEARQFNKQRPEYNRYVDATKDAEKTFADPTERQMKKWKHNPNQYDIKGVDDRQPAERRPQTELPIQRRRDRILYKGDESDLRKSMRKIPASIRRNATGKKEKMAKKVEDQGFDKMMAEKERLAVPQNALINNFDIPDVVEEERKKKRKKRSMNFKMRMLAQSGAKVRGYGEKLEAGSETRASKILKDSREIGTVGKEMRGTTSERSNQESLRDGNASKKSEKTLNKWEDNYI